MARLNPISASLALWTADQLISRIPSHSSFMAGIFPFRHLARTSLPRRVILPICNGHHRYPGHYAMAVGCRADRVERRLGGYAVCLLPTGPAWWFPRVPDLLWSLWLLWLLWSICWLHRNLTPTPSRSCLAELQRHPLSFITARCRLTQRRFLFIPVSPESLSLLPSEKIAHDLFSDGLVWNTMLHAALD